VNVVENASVLNTSTAEVGTRFDERRLSELPVATNRNVYNLALSAPGVSQLGPNQVGFANGMAPITAVELGRRGLSSELRPTADELEAMLKSLKSQMKPA